MGRRVDESVWDERRELLLRQTSSGMSAAGFCRENGVKLWNFHAWKRRLSGEGSSALEAKKSVGADDRPNSFLQIPIRQVPRTNADASWIEVSSAAGIVVRVPSRNLSALRTVLGALAVETTDD